jgi:hypothetical protein
MNKIGSGKQNIETASILCIVPAGVACVRNDITFG